VEFDEYESLLDTIEKENENNAAKKGLTSRKPKNLRDVTRVDSDFVLASEANFKGKNAVQGDEPIIDFDLE